MNRIHHIFALAIAAIALVSTGASAQRHSGASSREKKEIGGGRPGHSSSSSAVVPGGSTSSRGERPGSSSSSRGERPGAVNSGGYRPSYNSRPDQSGSRPDHNSRPDQSSRPGNSHGNDKDRPSRPDNGNHNGWNNGNHNGNHNGNNGNHNGWNNGNHNGNHGGNNNHGSYRPGHDSHRPSYINPPHRPHRPNMYRPSYRPAPPQHWHPHHGAPVINGILGLRFGVSFYSALDYLYHNGYSVDGYGNNIVYLRNVPVMNYIWTDGALYYGDRGFDVSSFYYTTPYYDMTRYNAVYANLVAQFGAPVAYNNGGRQLSSTWFGGNAGYVTLTYGPADFGRFMTTLTFGL